MRVVSNSSPVISLAALGYLSLLPDQFGVIHITPEVLEELALDRNRPGTATLDQARKEGWLRVTEATDRAMLQLLERELDRGEAASIVLALQLEADRLLLDEQEGRRIAKSLGIPPPVRSRGSSRGFSANPAFLSKSPPRLPFWALSTPHNGEGIDR